MIVELTVKFIAEVDLPRGVTPDQLCLQVPPSAEILVITPTGGHVGQAGGFETVHVEELEGWGRECHTVTRRKGQS